MRTTARRGGGREEGRDGRSYVRARAHARTHAPAWAQVYVSARARATDSRCARRAQLSSYKWFSIISFLDFSFSLSPPPLLRPFAPRGSSGHKGNRCATIALRLSINIRVAADRAISFSFLSSSPSPPRPACPRHPRRGRKRGATLEKGSKAREV